MFSTQIPTPNDIWRPEKIPSSDEIYAQFGLNSHLQKVPKEELEIDWDLELDDHIALHKDVLIEKEIRPESEIVYRGENKQGTSIWDHDKAFMTPVMTRKSQVRLEVFRRLLAEQDLMFEAYWFQLTSSFFRSGDIAELVFWRRVYNTPSCELGTLMRGNKWILRHRMIDPRCRGQLIASKLLQIATECIAGVGSALGKEQEIIAKTSQIPVLTWLLNNGFGSTSNRERIERVFEGDDSLVLKTDPNNSELERIPPYIFERDRLAKNPIDWSDDKYIYQSFRITLVKEFAPPSDMQNIQNETRQNLGVDS